MGSCVSGERLWRQSLVSSIDKCELIKPSEVVESHLNKESQARKRFQFNTSSDTISTSSVLNKAGQHGTVLESADFFITDEEVESGYSSFELAADETQERNKVCNKSKNKIVTTVDHFPADVIPHNRST